MKVHLVEGTGAFLEGEVGHRHFPLGEGRELLLGVGTGKLLGVLGEDMSKELEDSLGEEVGILQVCSQSLRLEDNSEDNSQGVVWYLQELLPFPLVG